MNPAVNDPGSFAYEALPRYELIPWQESGDSAQACTYQYYLNVLMSFKPAVQLAGGGICLA